TGGGVVRFSRVRGGLRGSSGSGPVIYAGDSDGKGEKGDLQDVTIDAARVRVGKGAHPGVLHIDKAGGGGERDQAPAGCRGADGAEVATGGGDVRIGRAAGMVDASTGGGDIVIGPVAGSVRASTGAGTVRIILVDAGAMPQSVDVQTGTGTVVLELPPDLDATFELETAYTKGYGHKTTIKSAWALERSETSSWDTGAGSPRR